MTPAHVVVAGGGVTGLTLAFTVKEEAARLGAAVDVTVFDAASTAGGHARSVEDGSFVIETGPNGFLDNEPETLSLVQALDLEARLVVANPAARRRFVVRRGRLCQLPSSPQALLASTALSWKGKLRLLSEPFAASPPALADETVFEFAERRLGREAAETLVDTAVSGISAGDSKWLSMRSQFPILKQWESDHGSLFRAMFAQRKKSKSRTRLLSFDRGIGTLTATLACRLGPTLRSGTALTTIERQADAWRVHLADGTTVAATHVVFTTPAQRTSQIVSRLDLELSTELASIPYAGLAVVALAYSKAALPRPLDGYGYLVTRAEQLSTMGVIWESSIFPGRAPDDAVLLRVFLGGALRPGVLDLDDEALLAVARSEVAQVLGIAARPNQHWAFRWPSAIAQYTVGQDDRVRHIRARLACHPGLHVCGTAIDGVSFNQAIASARRTGRRLAAGLVR